MPQETFLFHDTMLRNVTLGNEELTASPVGQALRDADAWDFVTRRPEGLETTVAIVYDIEGGALRRLNEERLESPV